MPDHYVLVKKKPSKSKAYIHDPQHYLFSADRWGGDKEAREAADARVASLNENPLVKAQRLTQNAYEKRHGKN